MKTRCVLAVALALLVLVCQTAHSQARTLKRGGQSATTLATSKLRAPHRRELVKESCPENRTELELVLNLTEPCFFDEPACGNSCQVDGDLSVFRVCQQTLQQLMEEFMGTCTAPRWGFGSKLGCNSLLSSWVNLACFSRSVNAPTFSPTTTNSMEGATAIQCANGVLDQIGLSIEGITSGESDVDCGGPWCTRCGEGKSCRSTRDCEKGSGCNGEFRCEKMASNEASRGDKAIRSTQTQLIVMILFLVFIFLLLITTIIYVRMVEKKEIELKKEERKRRILQPDRNNANGKPGRQTSTLKHDANSNTNAEPSNKNTPIGKGAKDKTGSAQKSTTKRVSLGIKRQALTTQEIEQAVRQTDSLKRVLSHPRERAKFFSFCQKKFAGENLLFWEAIGVYELLWEDGSKATMMERQRMGRHIVETYVVDGAKSQVNLAYRRRREILALYSQSDASGSKNIFLPDSFTEARKEIFNLMNYNFFSKFLSQEGSKETLEVITDASLTEHKSSEKQGKGSDQAKLSEMVSISIDDNPGDENEESQEDKPDGTQTSATNKSENDDEDAEHFSLEDMVYT